MTHPSLRSDAAANRDRLMEAARSVFVERGFDAEMKEIAERAGVGVGTIYRNFATKDDLVTAMLAGCLADSMVAVQVALRLPDPRERILALLAAGWEAAERFGPLIRAMSGHAPDPIAAHENVKRLAGHENLKENELLHHSAGLVGALVQAFEDARTAGVVRREIDPLFLAHYMVSQFQAYLGLRQVHPAELVKERMTDFFTRAVFA